MMIGESNSGKLKENVDIERLKRKENDGWKKTTYLMTRVLTGSRGEEGDLSKRVRLTRRNCLYG